MSMFSVSGPILAVKTINAINAALERDQGRRFRSILRETIKYAEDAYRDKEEAGFRSHLGASLVGRDCSRELWYTFRWFTRPSHEGRILRLFNRGHLEEARFIALLKMIDVEVWDHDQNGKQFRVAAHDGHFGGSLDSVLRGIPELPGVAILGEYKTHSEKSFNKLIQEGVRSAKFEHYVQMQIYMGGYRLPAALYLAVNKNDDDLYGEIVEFDPEAFARFMERSSIIVPLREPPQRVSESPGWYKCKSCDHYQVCHFKAEPARNCRTCRYLVPVKDGCWHCTYDLSQDFYPCEESQLQGCMAWAKFE